MLPESSPKSCFRNFIQKLLVEKKERKKSGRKEKEKEGRETEKVGDSLTVRQGWFAVQWGRKDGKKERRKED